MSSPKKSDDITQEKISLMLCSFLVQIFMHTDTRLAWAGGSILVKLAKSALMAVSDTNQPFCSAI